MFPLKISKFGARLPVAALAAGALLAFAACRDKGPDPVVLAQVDQSKLTLGELRESFPAEYEKVLPREQYLDLIQRWIDDEAVYQQALRRKLDEEPLVRRKLERLRRRVLIEEFLARETAAGAGVEPDEGAMMRYYDTHKNEFRRKTAEYRYQHIRLETLKEALALKPRLNAGNFAALAARNSLDSNLDLSALPFRKPSEIPACLHDVLDARPGWISSPTSCPDGVYLVRLQDRLEAGTALPFAEVRASISGQLAMQHRDRMREAKIRQYKEGASISLNVDQIPGIDPGTYAAPEPGAPADSADEERLDPGE